MRLINVNTMELEEYFGEETPRYAILSHCWGKDEVTFKDINGPSWRNMRGATKIQRACSVCRDSGEGYIWIDTCCIDKTSSAELSEAINSMFSWYENSAVCYAYLEDVDGHLKDTIRESRWFTRGWTLQELIAPNHMLFFNASWVTFGNKAGLSPLLSRITTIPENVLASPSEMRLCSVARKMSWAANRTTTREEDMAYSLFGIFQINMPLLYGEGKRAFTRLQEEILKETDDQSLFAWGLPQSQTMDDNKFGTGVLAPHPIYFAGSANIVPIPGISDRQPFSMTNRGLRIELPLLMHPSHYYKAVALLDCYRKNDFSYVIGVPLEKESSTSTESKFTRQSLGPLLHFSIAQAEKAETRTIYINKHPSKPFELPPRRCLILWDTLEKQGYRMLQVTPKHGWNEQTMVLDETSLAHNRDQTSRIVFGNQDTASYFVVYFQIFTILFADQPDKAMKAVMVSQKPEVIDMQRWLAHCDTWEVDWTLTLVEGHRYRNLQLLDWRGHPSPLTVSVDGRKKTILNQQIAVLDVRLCSLTSERKEGTIYEWLRSKLSLAISEDEMSDDETLGY